MAGDEDREEIHEETRKLPSTGKYLENGRFKTVLMLVLGVCYSLILVTVHYNSNGFDDYIEGTGASKYRSSFRRKLYENHNQKRHWGEEKMTRLR